MIKFVKYGDNEYKTIEVKNDADEDVQFATINGKVIAFKDGETTNPHVKAASIIKGGKEIIDKVAKSLTTTHKEHFMDSLEVDAEAAVKSIEVDYLEKYETYLEEEEGDIDDAVDNLYDDIKKDLGFYYKDAFMEDKTICEMTAYILGIDDDVIESMSDEDKKNFTKNIADAYEQAVNSMQNDKNLEKCVKTALKESVKKDEENINPYIDW